ncbi:putative membrane protein [Chitinophaga sp. W3I9]
MKTQPKKKPIDQHLHQMLILIFIALTIIAMGIKIVFL